MKEETEPLSDWLDLNKTMIFTKLYTKQQIQELKKDSFDKGYQKGIRDAKKLLLRNIRETIKEEMRDIIRLEASKLHKEEFNEYYKMGFLDGQMEKIEVSAIFD